MSVTRRQHNLSLDWAHITMVNGPSQGLANEITYDLEVFGLDGPNVLLEMMTPQNRSTNDVEIRPFAVGTLTMVQTVYVGELRSPSTTMWPIGSESIIFKDCGSEKPTESPIAARVISFFKRLIGKD